MKKKTINQIQNFKSKTTKSNEINTINSIDPNSSLLNFSLGLEKYKSQHTGNLFIQNSEKNSKNAMLNRCQNETLEKKLHLKNTLLPTSYNLLSYNDYDEVDTSSFVKVSNNNKMSTSSSSTSSSSLNFTEKFFNCFSSKLKMFFKEFNFNYLINILLLMLIIYNYVQIYYLKNDLCELKKKVEDRSSSLPLNPTSLISTNQKDYFYRIQKVYIYF
jgi:hypothetical protein